MKEVFEIDSEKVWQELQKGREVMCVVVFPTSEIVDGNRSTQTHGCYILSECRTNTVLRLLNMKKSIDSGFIRFFVRGEEEEERPYD